MEIHSNLPILYNGFNDASVEQFFRALCLHLIKDPIACTAMHLDRILLNIAFNPFQDKINVLQWE